MASSGDDTMLHRGSIAAVVVIGAVVLVSAATLDGGSVEAFLAHENVRESARGEGVARAPHDVLMQLADAVSGDGAEQPLHLGVPAATGLAVQASPIVPAEARAGELHARAYEFVSRVFERPRGKSKAIGFVRRGITLRARERVTGDGCAHGAWYRLQGPGFVCSREGFAISRERQPASTRQPLPAVDRALPFDYGKAKEGALRLYRLPEPKEERAITAAVEAGERPPEPVERELDGIFLLALDREEQAADHSYYRTVRGRYVRADLIEPKPEPEMHGELLGKRMRLPLAFVYGEGEAPLYRCQDGECDRAGSAATHARFPVATRAVVDGEPLVVGRSGIAVARDRVRVARRRSRPEAVGPSERWIHIDLDQQTLVAYEGDRAVLATLVSSGKGPEHATPAGLFRVYEKHISTTMTGADPEAGYYEVEEVPWTQYYHDSYALHGAYWHDSFGATRSHGCTNISPADARWLFYWTDGEVPPGWNAVRKLEGTWVLFTRAESEAPSAS